jgi:hypothetical protein
MCDYSMKNNLNGLEQHVVCDLNVIVWTSCIIC